MENEWFQVNKNEIKTHSIQIIRRKSHELRFIQSFLNVCVQLDESAAQRIFTSFSLSFVIPYLQ